MNKVTLLFGPAIAARGTPSQLAGNRQKLP
jgi:hypothetical protein